MKIKFSVCTLFFPLKPLGVILTVLLLCNLSKSHGQQISPYLYGQNAWMPDIITGGEFDDVIASINAKGDKPFKIIRIGGTTFDDHPPSNAEYESLINTIRSIGAEPLLQIPLSTSISDAAALVEWINDTQGLNVTYWSIGNEPDLGWLDESVDGRVINSADDIAFYFKTRASAMKAVDNTIKIFGPDFSFFVDEEDNAEWHPMDTWQYPLLENNDYDLWGKDANGNYYVDYYAFHVYQYVTPDNVERKIQTVMSDINTINTNYRDSNHPLGWAITETHITTNNDNVDEHDKTWGFYAGQHIAQIIALGMKYQAFCINPWSIHESGGLRDAAGSYEGGAYDLGFFDHGPDYNPRSTYYHEKMLSEKAKNFFVSGYTNDDSLKQVSTKDDTGFAIMIMNDNHHAGNFTLRLNEDVTTNTFVINVDADLAIEFEGSIGPYETQMLFLDEHGSQIGAIIYSKANEAAHESPIASGLTPDRVALNNTKTVQPFEIELVVDYQNVRNKAQDTYMRPEDGAPNRKIHQWESTFVDAGLFSSYQWELRPAATEGYYYFVNKSTGQIHKPTGESLTDSSLDGSYTLDGTTKDNDFFMYSIEEVDGDAGYFHIKNKGNGYYIRPNGGGDDPDGGGALTRNDVQIRHQSSSVPTFNSYRWYFEPRDEAGTLAANEWNGTAWSNVVPPRYNNVDIDGDYSVSTQGSFESNHLTVKDNATLTIEAGEVLVVHGNLTVGTLGAVVIESGGSLVTKGTVSGFGFTIKRQTSFNSSTGKYSVVGSPITEASTSVLGSLIYAYDETVAYGTGGQERFSKITTPETMGVGDAYFSAFTDEVTFVGKPNTGNLDVSLVYDETNDGSATNAGFNLVSNPYPAAINYDEFVALNVTTNAAISGTVYLWDDGGSNTTQRGNGDYITANSLGSASGGSSRSGDWNGHIGSAQGFFVKATQVATLSFTDAMKVEGDNEDAAYFRKVDEGNVASFSTVKLVLTDHATTAAMETLIGLASDATTGIDPLYDGESLGGNNGVGFYSLIDGEKPYAIQGLPTSLSESVALGFDLASSGTYSISLAALNNWPADLPVVLFDLELGTKHTISETSAYTFTSTAGINNDRFLLFAAPQTVLSQTNELSALDVVYHIDGIRVNHHSPNEAFQMQILDISGKLLMNEIIESSQQSINLKFQFTQTNLYLVKTTTNTSTKTEKVYFK